MTRFLVIPQWQGSPFPRAMLLTEGAAAIAGDLPRATTRVLEIPLEAGDALGSGVQRLSSLLRIRELIAEEMRDAADDHTIVIGGDCGVTPAALAALTGTSDLAVLWCDAHGDLHTPETSPSGAFAGMALRALTGAGAAGLALDPGVPPERIVLLGGRELDPEEQQLLATSAITRLESGAIDDPDALADAITATGAARVWVHLDIDVLGPDQIEGVFEAVPFGVTVTALVASLKRLRERVPLAGATVAGFAPRSAADAVEDMGAILRLIGALA